MDGSQLSTQSTVVELRLRTDLAGLEQRLAQAEWQVAEGKRHVARQRDLADWLSIVTMAKARKTFCFSLKSY